MSLYGALQVRTLRLGKNVGIEFVEITLDGANPSSFQTGFRSILWAGATGKATTAGAPGAAQANYFKVDYPSGSPGRVDVYAFNNTLSTDSTLLASTNATHVVSVAVIGTYGDAS